MTAIYVDADACPVKTEVFRVAERHALPVTLVAGSWMRVPGDARIRLEVVESGFDAADDWIAEHVVPGDIVVTEVTKARAGGLDLVPEKSKAFTFGFGVQPVRELNITVDYWNTVVRNALATNTNGDSSPSREWNQLFD